MAEKVFDSKLARMVEVDAETVLVSEDIKLLRSINNKLTFFTVLIIIGLVFSVLSMCR